MSIILSQWFVSFCANKWNTSYWVKYANIQVFSDTRFPVYGLGFCSYKEKFGSEKTFIFTYLIGVQLSLWVTTFFFFALVTYCAWSTKLATLTFSCSFLAGTRNIFVVYISGSVTIHLLGINTESIEFQPNSTGFKLVSGADIRLEQIKAT